MTHLFSCQFRMVDRSGHDNAGHVQHRRGLRGGSQGTSSLDKLLGLIHFDFFFWCSVVGKLTMLDGSGGGKLTQGGGGRRLSCGGGGGVG